MADSEEVSVSNDSEPLLSVRHLRKSYGDHEVLKDVSFDVKRGQVFRQVHTDSLPERFGDHSGR